MMRSKNWDDTELGPKDLWPQSLKTSVSTCLNSRFAILIWWGPGLIKLYNDAYSVILGNKHPYALGRAGREVWREIWDIIGPMLRGVMEQGEATWSDDLLLLLERHGYAEECYFTFSYSPIRDESGGIGGIFTPVQETTGRVIGERRTRTLMDLASRRSALVLSKTKSAEEACRSACEALAANPYDLPFACLYLFDHARQQAHLAGVAGIPPGASITPETVSLTSSAFPAFSAAIESRTMQVIEDLPIHFADLPQGAWHVPAHAAVVCPIVLPGQDRPDGVLLSAVNPRKHFDPDYRAFFEMIAGQVASSLAEVYAFEREAKRAEELAAIDRAKTTFFSNVSHEFRTPLTLMLGPLEELLEPESGLDWSTVERLTLVHRNGLRLQRLVNVLLDFSRIEAGRVEPVLEPTVLSRFTIELASNFDSVVRKASLRFTVDCPPLPRVVEVDRQMWEKIVFNLVSNAFKFTFEGSITVRLRDAGAFVELTVEDTGEGIPESELPHIFERFHRVQSARARTHEGTGIGLALVSELARLQGGSVSVQSVLGRGSTFTVSMPAVRKQTPGRWPVAARELTPTALNPDVYIDETMRWLPESQSLAFEGATAMAGTKMESPRILLVDDNADMRDYITHLLKTRFSVVAVSNGADALQQALNATPDLVLTDVMMPGIDGFGLIRELRAHPETSHLPIILLSARAGEESRLEGVQAGADDYLIKPFTARELLARVQAHLEISRIRRESADRIRRSEQELRLITDYAPVSLVRFDRDGRYLYINRRHAERFGRKPEEMLGKNLQETVGQSWYETVWPRFSAALRGEFVEFEAEFDYVNSGPRWMRVWYVPEFDPRGEVPSVVAVLLDITERHAAEVSLRENSEHLNLALEVGHLGTWNWDMRTGENVWSAEQYRVVGLEPGSAPSSYATWAERVHPEDLPLVEAALEAAARSRQEFQCEYRTLWPDGTTHWAEAKGSYFYDAQGAAIRMIGVATDITERRRIDEARRAALVREQEARKTAELLNQIGPALASELDIRQLTQKITDIATQLTHAEVGAFYYNGEEEHQQLYALSGVTREVFERAMFPVDTPLAGTKFSSRGTIRSGDIPADARYSIGARTGGIAVRSYLAVPVLSRHGEVLGKLVFASSKPDVFTQADEDLAAGIAAQSGVALDNARLFEESVRAQEQLQHSNEELLAANRELEQFAYVASHDLQEPLRMVNSYTQLLLRRFGPQMDNPDVKEFASYISGGVHHMQLLIQDLLVYSQVIHSDQLESAGTADLDAAVQQALAMLRETIVETGAVLFVEPLPLVAGDAGQFEQVFQNLISNALKYRRAEVAPEIRIYAEQTGDEWVVAVGDNGIGFDMQYAERIFGLFKRLHKAEYPGTGIGLAICKRIVERARGRMWAVSELGKGSTFYFSVPVASGNAAMAEI